MDSQLFLFVNLILGAIFFLWFLSGRTTREKATPLDLKKGSFATPPVSNEKLVRPVIPPEKPVSAYKPVDPLPSTSRQLNILFLYNGHDWDAYQVLGVPAGAGLSIVTERYQQLIKKADPGQLGFYEAAYKAILKKM